MIALSQNTKLVRHSAAVAAGASTITPTDGVDCAGFEGCMFVAAFGSIVSGGAQSVKVQQSDDDGDTDAYSDLEGTSVTVADDDDGLLVYVDVCRPVKRYLKMLVLRATQNSTLDNITAILYGPRVVPTTHDATTVAGGELHVTPAEGTA